MENRIRKIITGLVNADRVVGAYLFCGPPTAGKLEAAEELAKALNCARQDRIVLGPQGASFKIDQIRNLQKLVQYGPSISRYLLVIIDKADTLTDEAVAAFLKTLEEPAPGVVFVLLVDREDKLPGTVLSRCQKIFFTGEEWQPDQGCRALGQELQRARQKGPLALLEFSTKLEKEKERVEDLLYSLVYDAYYQLNDLKLARTILEAVKNIKKKANLRMALDVACLRLAQR